MVALDLGIRLGWQQRGSQHALIHRQDSTYRAVTWTAAAPADGTWAVGDMAFDSTTADRVGWRCTTAGTPGTWEEIGAPGGGGSGTEVEVNGGGALATANFNDSTPAAPADGDLPVLFQESGGDVSGYVEESALVARLPNFVRRGWSWWAPGNDTAPLQLGLHRNPTGTISHPNPSTASYRESIRRWHNQTGPSAGANNTHERSWTTTIASGRPFWRGNAANQGGYFIAILGMSWGANSTSRIFNGIFGEAASAGVATTNDPSTYLNIFGVGADDTDANMQIISTDGAGNVTKVDLGFLKTVTDRVYDIFIFCDANGSEIFYRLVRRDTSATDIAGSLTAASDDIPDATAFCGLQLHMGYPGGSVAATYYETRGVYTEWGVGQGVRDYGLVM